jgi:pimeloyl-ACP methyl ester carboxylesterase
MGIAIVCAVLLAVPLAATAATYAAARKRGESGGAALGPLRALLAFAQEWLATTALLAACPWRLPPPASAACRRVAILVPERCCSSATFWYVRRRLRKAGWESAAGRGRTRHSNDPAELAAIDACVAALPEGTAIAMIGHGMGGRLALVYAAARPNTAIRQIVTLGTPHQGSTALPYRVIGGGAPSTAAADRPIDIIAIASDFDAWLQPFDRAYHPDGFNIAISGVGHCAMLLSRRVTDLLVENLTAAPPPRT